MKIKSLFAILLALTLLTCTFILPVSAKNETNNKNDIQIIINDEVSAETKDKIQRYFANGAHEKDEAISTYGLTCTLFGHKLESCTVSAITHKVSATSPRCVKKTYNYEACSRCDYENSELIATEYIVCCS